MSATKHSSSFRDPSGFVFVDNGILKRQINPIYFENYNALKSSGFFELLFKNNLLITHKELSATHEKIVIQPDYIPFITYPYEWCFNQYKEAALLTLKLQKLAINKGFTLKDASAFNVTFYKGNAIFIDSLSFEPYKKNEPWRAYKQFITHFLGPLVLAHYHGASSLKILNQFIDGVPLQLLTSILPFSSKLNPFLATNIHLLAKFEAKHKEDYIGKSKSKQLSKQGQLNILETLFNYIKKLKLKEFTEWGNYYTKTNYSTEAFTHKAQVITTWVNKLKAKTLIDIGGNDGTFVRKLPLTIEQALVCDIDNTAVDINYKQLKQKKETHILPFVLDVLNPSASIGFNNLERLSFLKRITQLKPDVTLALAVIHHMSLSGNITFAMSAQFFAEFSNYLIIEFPKRTDSWVQRLLKTKGEFETYFNFYNEENFKTSYLSYFNIIEEIQVENSKRKLFLLKKK